ncbi:probable ATP-dependent RNA helicase DDX20 [Watersipora subatra]|uniref:probable ATP-dependent RNA helicase DDX20 n=1 Tax=Watersipora subatra TaxID=2589382 RepID=UPI00355BD955
MQPDTTTSSDTVASATPPKIGHQVSQKPRTEDIRLDEDLSFHSLGLGPLLLKGLSESGFEKPSPIQLASIPYGRCGLDLVVQAKSGTGKTCVFTIIALESVNIDVKSPQVLMLTPTREIALQVEEVVKSIGRAVPGLTCHCSIGGLSVKEDKGSVNKAHIVIGTPGRVKQLMELSALVTSSVRLFVLDEADKLLEASFQDQINWIYSGLPESKQMIAASATYKEEVVQHLCNYMHNPTFVRLNSNDPVLLGVRQYKIKVATGSLPSANYDNKVAALTEILSHCHFQQCLVFSNLMTRAENLSKLMVSRGWPTAHIAGSQEQDERIKAITRLKSYDCRILISTDLTSRGIDADRIDLVINLDLPYDCETYLHRVGRAGRFGSNGAAITLYTEAESSKLDSIAEEIGTTIQTLPEELPTDFIHNPSTVGIEISKTVQVETFQIVTDKVTVPSTRNGVSIASATEVTTKVTTSSCAQTKADDNTILQNGSKHVVPSTFDDAALGGHSKSQGPQKSPADVESYQDISQIPANSELHNHTVSQNQTCSLNLTRPHECVEAYNHTKLCDASQNSVDGDIASYNYITQQNRNKCMKELYEQFTDDVTLTDSTNMNVYSDTQEMPTSDVVVPLTDEVTQPAKSHPLEIISHRPPFAKLEDATKFLANPKKCKEMLETTIYSEASLCEPHSSSHSSHISSFCETRAEPVDTLSNTTGKVVKCEDIDGLVNCNNSANNVYDKPQVCRHFNHTDSFEDRKTKANQIFETSSFSAPEGKSSDRIEESHAHTYRVSTNKSEYEKLGRDKNSKLPSDQQNESYPYEPVEDVNCRDYDYQATDYSYSDYRCRGALATQSQDYNSKNYDCPKKLNSHYQRQDWHKSHEHPPSRVRPRDEAALRRALDIHYRQVYLQFSYIRGMARPT